MPMDYGSNLNGQDADLLEDTLNSQAILTSLTLRPSLEWLFGEELRPGSDMNLRGDLDTPPNLPQLANLRRWGGRGKIVRLNSEDGNWEDLDGTFASQMAGVVPVPKQARGQAVFYYDHLHNDSWISLSDWEDALDSPLKMDDLVSEDTRALAASLATKLSLNGFHGSGTPGKGSIGSWRDLTAQTGTYGGIDRALAANVDFKAQAYTGFGVASWTYKKLVTAMSYCQAQGGMPNVAFLTRTMWTNALDGLKDEITPTENEEMLWLRYKWPRVGSLRLVLDNDTGGAAADENTFAVFDARYFRVLWKKMRDSKGRQADFAFGPYERNKSFKGMIQSQTDAKVQIIHIMPKVNVLVTN